MYLVVVVYPVVVVAVVVSIPTAPLCTSIVAFSVVAVVVCRSCVDQKWSFLFALQKVLSYQTICQRLGPARKAPRGRGGCCSSQAFCWLVKICWHMRWCFCCCCRCSCCFAHQQINALGPPVKINKIAVLFLTKSRESSVTRNKTRKTPKRSWEFPQFLASFSSFKHYLKIWPANYRVDWCVPIIPSFIALCRSNWVCRSVSLPFSLCNSLWTGENGGLFCCCCCCSRAISKAPRRLITLFIGLSDWVGDRTAWTT